MRLILIIAALSFLHSNAFAADEVRTAPDWTLESTDGESVTLSEVSAEKPVIVLFWATWCPYCKALMPHLQSVSLEYDDDISILAVNFRSDKGDPVAFIENAGYDFTLLPNGEDVARLNDVWGTPGLLLIDTNRQIRFDLYELPKLDLSAAGESMSHGRKSAQLAPYWAAELRKSLDMVLGN